MTSDDELLELETAAIQSIDGELRGPALKAAARIRELSDMLDECERAFESLAALDDHGANDRLAATGSYGSFDEPGAVRVSRSMLAMIRAAQPGAKPKQGE